MSLQERLLDPQAARLYGIIKSPKVMQAEINLNKDMALKAIGETEEMTQYLRSDCLEILGVKSNAEFSSENIVESIGKVLNVSVTENDISVAAKINCGIRTHECS